MDILLQIFVGLLALASFFFAYKAYQTWRIVDVLLIVTIFFLSFGFIYLTARAFKAQAGWRDAVRKYEVEVKKQEGYSQELVEGTKDAEGHPTPGIVELQKDLNKLALDRGEVWLNAQHSAAKADTGAVTLTIDAPDPHHLPENAVVYVFAPGAEKNSSATYIGKFKVASAPEKSKTVEIVPEMPLTAPDILKLQKLSRAAEPWNVHLIMPIDDADVFASMTEGGRSAFFDPLPKDVQDEMGTKNRTLRDYDAIFKDYYFGVTAFLNAKAQIENNIARLVTAINQKKEDIAYREQEKKNLTGDLAKFKYEDEQTTQYLAKLTAQRDTSRAELKRIVADNKRLADKIAAWQTNLAAEINRRAAEAAVAPE